MGTSMKEWFTEDTLGIRELQAFHVALDRQKGFDQDLLRNVAYLAGELGEVVEAVRQLQREDGEDGERAAKRHLGEELADCLAYVLKLANYAGIDLQVAYVAKMRRNVTRAWPGRTGDAGQAITETDRGRSRRQRAIRE